MLQNAFGTWRQRFTRLASIAPFLLVVPGTLVAQGLTYSFTPSARWIEWDEDLLFSQTRLLGGSVGIGFGRYVGLNAFHHQESDVSLFENPDLPAASSHFDLAQSGVQVSLALGSGTVVPVLLGGGSVLRFDPAEGERQSKLSLDMGAGFRTVFGETLHGEVILETTQYRLDSDDLLFGPSETGGLAALRRNLTLRAGLGLQLGRRSFDQARDLDNAFAQRYQAPFSNFALALEPMAGRLDYDKAVGLPDQDMVGLRAGVDFGSFFGLRGFHWWGTDSDFRNTDGMTAWGGEAQFTLSAGPGLNPYLAGGVGQLSWEKAKEGEDPKPVDQSTLIVGGGVDFNFGPHIRATVAARDFILAGSDLMRSPDLQAVVGPDDLVHNWQLSAGLKFMVGRSGIRSAKPTQDEVRYAETSTPSQQPRPQEPTTVSTAPEPTAASVPQVPSPANVVAPDTLPKGLVPGQTIVLPVLERGEIYIRFGEPGSTPLISTARGIGAEGLPGEGVTLEELRTLIREEMAAQRGVTDPTATMTSAEIQALEARLQERIADLEEATRRARAATVTAPVVAVPASGGDQLFRRVSELRPITGLHLGSDVQFVVGLGSDIGPLRPGSPIRLVPQISIGVGQGPTSYMITADLEYRLPTFDVGQRFSFEPIVSLGPGLIKRNKMELQLGMFLGSGIQVFRSGNPDPLNLIAGIQGIDSFDSTRLIVGYRWYR